MSVIRSIVRFALASALLLVPVPSLAQERGHPVSYRWLTDDGAWIIAHDLADVPQRYRDIAREHSRRTQEYYRHPSSTRPAMYPLLYSWVDDADKWHMVLELEHVPERYREQARVRAEEETRRFQETRAADAAQRARARAPYTWTDDKGVSHEAKRLNDVPEPHRTQIVNRLREEGRARAKNVRRYHWPGDDGVGRISERLEDVPERYRTEAIAGAEACAQVMSAPVTGRIVKAPDVSRARTDVLSDYQAALAWALGIASDIHPSFGKVTAADMRVYPDPDAFAAAVRDAGAPVLRLFAGAAVRGVIYIDHRRACRRVTSIVGHELGHVIFRELSPGTALAPNWANEGFAEWFDLQLRRRLGFGGRPDYNESVWLLARTDPARRPRLKDIDAVRKVDAVRKFGMPAVYGAGSLAITLLVEKHGLDAVLDYFSRLATAPSDAAFRAAFKRPIDDLEKEMGRAPGRHLPSDARQVTAAHSPESNAACSSTVWVALSCLSGGYPYFRRIRLTSTRSCARRCRAASSRS